MFYWLIELSNSFPPGFGALRTVLNVFRYITFRTGGAVATGALFVFLFGPWIIDHLRLRQGKGQPIRTDGPQSHIITKKGTPTMGGVPFFIRCDCGPSVRIGWPLPCLMRK